MSDTRYAHCNQPLKPRSIGFVYLFLRVFPRVSVFNGAQGWRPSQTIHATSADCTFLYVLTSESNNYLVQRRLPVDTRQSLWAVIAAQVDLCH